jgi:UDP-glucose 6-dehydrogenase
MSTQWTQNPGGNMNIAIIGNGIVGKATKKVLIGNVSFHDPKQGLECDYKDADVVFICTPTDYVQEYLKELTHHPYVFIRSTIPFDLVVDTDFAVWPEFLTERSWQYDAKNPLCLICGGNIEQVQLLKEITDFQKWYLPNLNWFQTTNHTAALMKNATNVFYAMKVSYANMLHSLCQENNLSYNELKHCLKQDPRMGNVHWDVPGPDGKKGFGGKCFPANLELMIQQMTDNDLLIEVEKYNKKLR